MSPDCNRFGKSGSLTRGLERESSSICVSFSILFMRSMLRSPPTRITGVRICVARAAAKVPGTPLYRLMNTGRYEESTEKEKLEEAREFVRCIQNETVYMTEHASNQFHVCCNLPEDREAVMKYIQKMIDEKDENELRRYRERIARVF